jgi:AcrR family transcriptional regulator
LLATAKELFLRDGYSATSVDAIAEQAGYSKGAVYSNFRNKNELCMAVLDEVRAERASEIVTILQAPTMDDRARGLAAWAERVMGDPDWTRLEMQFGLEATADPSLRADLAERIGQVRELLSAGLVGATGTGEVDLPMSNEDTTLALLCMGVGLGLFRSIDPSLPVSAFINAGRLLTGAA